MRVDTTAPFASLNALIVNVPFITFKLWIVILPAEARSAMVPLAPLAHNAIYARRAASHQTHQTRAAGHLGSGMIPLHTFNRWVRRARHPAAHGRWASEVRLEPFRSLTRIFFTVPACVL